jgi:hypothetical protein
MIYGFRQAIALKPCTVIDAVSKASASTINGVPATLALRQIFGATRKRVTT